MGWMTKLADRLLGRGAQASPPENDAKRKGFLAFQHTGDVIRAEQTLAAKGFSVSVMAPPPQMRTGCDMVLVFDIMLEPSVRSTLAEAGITPEAVVPMSDPLLEPVSLYQVKDFGHWFMVRAANMKITVEIETGKIVNISGGGCPDVPYLAMLLNGRRLDAAEEPRRRGQTLCAYALQRAFEEAQRRWGQKRCAG